MPKGISTYWAPQCNSCNGNIDGTSCSIKEKKIPEDIYWGEKRCEDYSHLEGSRRPKIQQTPETYTEPYTND